MMTVVVFDDGGDDDDDVNVLIQFLMSAFFLAWSLLDV